MTLISVPIKTFSSEALVRISILFWVHYDTDITKAIGLITETMNSFDFVKEKSNTKVFLSAFGDSSIEIK
jgi:small-conductance mechanosensitive channel